MAAAENERDWDLHLPMVTMAYRTSMQESTGCTPFYMMFGREARLPADVMFRLPSPPLQTNEYVQDMRFRLEQAYQQVRDRLNLQQRRQKALYDRGTHGSMYAVGDLVSSFRQVHVVNKIVSFPAVSLRVSILSSQDRKKGFTTTHTWLVHIVHVPHSANEAFTWEWDKKWLGGINFCSPVPCKLS